MTTPIGVESKGSVIKSATATSLLISFASSNSSQSISSNLKVLSTASAVSAYSYMTSASADNKDIPTLNASYTTATMISAIQTTTMIAVATDQKIATNNTIEETTTPTPLVVATTEPAYAYISEFDTEIKVFSTAKTCSSIPPAHSIETSTQNLFATVSAPIPSTTPLATTTSATIAGEPGNILNANTKVKVISTPK
ncbi:MAG: hypothetical protein Q9213_008127 [Squamulea squamosa]